jgi:hypothetical protein
VNDDAARGQDGLRRDPAQVQEWLRQNNLIYGAAPTPQPSEEPGDAES